MYVMKQLEDQLSNKTEELNLYSQILGTPRSDPAFEMVNSNLKIAPLTQQMAKLMIHMTPNGDKPATCLTPISTNEEPALATINHVTPGAASEGWLPRQVTLQAALYQPFQDEAIKAIQRMHLHSTNSEASSSTPRTPSPTPWTTTLPPTPPPTLYSPTPSPPPRN
jgi:hypothetical protein